MKLLGIICLFLLPLVVQAGTATPIETGTYTINFVVPIHGQDFSVNHGLVTHDSKDELVAEFIQFVNTAEAEHYDYPTSCRFVQ